MSLSIKSNGVVKHLLTTDDIGLDSGFIPSKEDMMIPPSASEDGTSFSNNFALVDLTNRDSLCNQPAYFGYSPEQLQSGNVIAIPTNTDVNQPFLGYREVFPLHVSADSNSHVMVKVTEFYPVAGREHYNFYNTNQWSGWKTRQMD